MSGIDAGKYLGSGLGGFDVKADKSTISGNQTASAAVNTSKGHSGAEVVTIDSEGNASAHALTVKDGTFTHPKKINDGLILTTNLSSSSNVDKTKPLAIAPNIASAFGGSTAILVDEKNQTTVIGKDAKSTAAGYLNSPTAKKVDAAYTIAGDDNFVNKKMASNVVNSLSANYRATDSASSSINLLKEGQVKTGMNALIGELKTLSANTSDLEIQSKNRTAKYNTDIAKPQDRLNKANSAWDSANYAEQGKVNQASEGVREAQFPGVHDTERALDNAKQMVADGRGYLQKATEGVTNAQNNVNRLENLRDKGENLRTETRQLEIDNKQIGVNMINYMVNRRDQLSSMMMTLNNKAQYFDSLANQEDRKPVQPQENPTGGSSNTQDPFSNGNKPSGNSNSSDPFSNKPATGSGKPSNTNDPFSGGSKPAGNSNTQDPFSNKPANSGKPSNTSDPFSNGGKPTGNSNTQDPFSNGNNSTQYKNTSLVQDYRNKASETRSDAMSLDMRIKGLNQSLDQAKRYGIESYNFRNSINSMDDGRKYSSYGYVFEQKDQVYFTDESSDRAVIKNNFVRPYDENVATINSNVNTINSYANEYRNNIDSANQSLQNAKVNESQASGNLAGAQASVTQYTAELQRINGRPPQPDSNPDVKTAKGLLSKAQKHMDDTVGSNAPLTKEKTTAQGVVDQINGSYKHDTDDLNGKINANATSAQQKINVTKQNLGL